MAPRKKKKPICMFCSASSEELAVLFAAGPEKDGICDACVVRFHARLYELKYLDMISTKHMTKH